MQRDFGPCRPSPLEIFFLPCPRGMGAARSAAGHRPIEFRIADIGFSFPIRIPESTIRKYSGPGRQRIPPRNGEGEGMARTKGSREGFSVRRRAFEKMVKGAMETLPRELKDQLENVAFIVEDEPSDLPDEWGEDDQDLLGLYHGVSRKNRGFWYGNTLPDRILIYQRPLERISTSLPELEENIRQTVIHEVGHYFGFDEEELEALERDMKKS